MYELKTIFQFGAAHQLRNYNGKCEHLHGHNWKIEVFVKGEELDDAGLLVDFKVIKDKTNEIIDRLDHKFLNDLEYFKKNNPSSENIAKYIFDELSKDINDSRISVSRVTAWESDNACATYSVG
ncbi:MAG: 6-carboxytetrahydropterin synthase QueD [Deltaproteobacteria bacterium]|nr:6-carboxytetrahydropterin synthase QueD [Deltaproteobacteria bacterium]